MGVKTVRLVAVNSLGTAITRGRTYIGYPDEEGFEVENNNGSIRSYSARHFKVKNPPKKDS